MPVATYDPKKHSIFRSRHRICTACVGEQGIGDFETYAIGYFEATKLLLDQVLDLKRCLTQDTLVYPILFNLRHGVELSIKHVLKVLSEAGLADHAVTQNTHELKQLWSDLSKQAHQDRRVIAVVAELEPAVLQMHEADPLAQEFRYGERSDGVPSFKGRSIVDMATVLELTDFTTKRFDALFGLVAKVRQERQHGSFTAELNRAELEQLSNELPDASQWANSNQFKSVKAEWMKRYQLSSRAFSRAIDFIKNHREFSANIGLAKPFTSLTDDDLDRLLSASIELLGDQLKGAAEDWSKRPRFDSQERAKFKSAGLKLSVPLVGEVNAIFYLGRDSRYSEEYEGKLEYHSRHTESVTQQSLWANFAHVFGKMNFAECMCRGLRMTGHPKIADKFEPNIKLLKARHSKLATRSPA